MSVSDQNSDNEREAYLMPPGMPPKYYGKDYSVAKTEEELLCWLGEACCVSAYNIVEAFKLPKHGRIMLRLFKQFSPDRYKNHHYQWGFFFTHCLYFENLELRNLLTGLIPETELARVAFDAYHSAAASWSVSACFDADETEVLISQLNQRIEDYEDLDRIEPHHLLNNLREGLGRQLAKYDALKIINMLLNPLRVVEPVHFAERWNALHGT